LGEPHGNIYFAGGDIAALAIGSIDGAIESGISTSRKIISRLSTKKEQGAA